MIGCNQRDILLSDCNHSVWIDVLFLEESIKIDGGMIEKLIDESLETSRYSEIYITVVILVY